MIKQNEAENQPNREGMCVWEAIGLGKPLNQEGGPTVDPDLVRAFILLSEELDTEIRAYVRENVLVYRAWREAVEHEIATTLRHSK